MISIVVSKRLRVCKLGGEFEKLRLPIDLNVLPINQTDKEVIDNMKKEDDRRNCRESKLILKPGIKTLRSVH